MAANILVIAPVLIQMSIWTCVWHRPFRQSLSHSYRKSDFFGRSVENNRSAVEADTGSVAKILSNSFIAGNGKVCKPFSKPQHQNDFDKIFATSGTEL